MSGGDKGPSKGEHTVSPDWKEAEWEEGRY
jgi:hypothetical protein